MYSMPKLHKHLFKMEFSLATLKKFEFYTILKKYGLICRQDCFLKGVFYFHFGW